MVSIFAYFVEHKIDHQAAKFQCNKLPGPTFTEEIAKQQYHVILKDFIKFAYFVKLNIGDQLTKFQRRKTKTQQNTITTSFPIIGCPNLRIL